MNQYIITFYSHFGAIRFKKNYEKNGIAVTLMPVPRFLSSSCGTCAELKSETEIKAEGNNEIEQIVRMTNELSSGNPEYEVLYSSY